MSPSPMDKNWTVFVMSRVYAGKVNEDGERPDQLCFFVVCENERGDRFASFAHWTTEEFPAYYVGDRKIHRAEQKADVLRQKVEETLKAGKGDPSTSEKWVRIEPCYGSKAYEIYGQAEEVAWEGKMG